MSFDLQPVGIEAVRELCERHHGYASAGNVAVYAFAVVENSQNVAAYSWQQMKYEIDRTRWPVLVTYSNEGQGHTGYVYKCSGWEATTRRFAIVKLDASGARASRYSNGRTNSRDLVDGGPYLDPTLGALGV